jgi:hypothetical protein
MLRSSFKHGAPLSNHTKVGNAHVCATGTCQVDAGALFASPAHPAPSLHGMGVNTQDPVEVHVSARGEVEGMAGFPTPIPHIRVAPQTRPWGPESQKFKWGTHPKL